MHRSAVHNEKDREGDERRQPRERSTLGIPVEIEQALRVQCSLIRSYLYVTLTVI
jgi:hypothetical protein